MNKIPTTFFTWMACFLRVICGSYGGTSPSLVLTTDTQRFLFDSGEGVQRLCIEHRVRLSKMEGVFLTWLSQETVAGLPGLSLTCAESGKNGMRIIGPHGLQSFWNSSSNFTYRPQFPVTLHEQAGLTVNNVDSLVFDKVLIHCLSIGSEHSHLCYVIETKSLPGKFDVVKAKALGVPKGPLFGQLQNGKNVILEDGKTITPEEVVGPSEKARYAIIICNCVQSDSLVLALVEHPFWQRFYEDGELTVQLDCVIHLSPHSVMSSGIYTKWMGKFGRTSCHLLLGEGNCAPITAFQASTLHTAKLNKLFPSVFSSLTLCDSSPDSNLTPGVASSCVAAYPGLTYALLPLRARGLEPFSINQTPVSGDILVASQSWVREEVSKFWKEIGGDDLTSPLATSLSEALAFRSHTLKVPETSVPLPGIFCEDNSIAFLGTGCAQPSKYRNVSGIFLQLDGGALLLDCGEGTWQQLIRMATHTPAMMRGTPPVDVQLWAAREVRVIWISHPHADHHLGVIRVISERKRLLTLLGSFEPLLLIAPENVLNFVRAFEEFDSLLPGSYLPVNNRCFDTFELKLRCNPCGDQDSVLSASRLSATSSNASTTAPFSALGGRGAARKRTVDSPELLAETLNQLALSQPILSALGIETFENIRVIHCSQSYAVSIVSKKGWKLVYSGDTRPCARLVEMGQGATVLIHEATFADCKAEEALKKKHSTVSEAISVAQQMNAQRLILTHFSQRYPSTPPLPPLCLSLQEEIETEVSGKPLGTLKVILAFDFMRLTLRDCLWAHALSASLTFAFPPEEEELERGEDPEEQERVTGGEAGSSKATKKTGRQEGRGALDLDDAQQQPGRMKKQKSEKRSERRDSEDTGGSLAREES